MFGKFFATAVLVAMLAVGATTTKSDAATLIGTFDGNDPFPDAYSGSPSLAKCDQGGTAGVVCSNWEDGQASGNHIPGFTVTFLDAFSISWSFDAGDVTGVALADVLFPSYIAVKAGNQYNVFSVVGLLSGEVDSLNITNRNGISQAISHVSFYDTAPPLVPLPAAGWLLISALGGIAAMRRLRKV